MACLEDSKEFSIRALTLDDLELFKAIRLQAITLHPDVFLDNAENAKERSNEQWANPLLGSQKCVFGLFHFEKIIGLAAIFPDKEEAQTGLFAMGYIEKSFRRKGLSSLLYKARLQWAREHSHFKRIIVYHRNGNEASKRSMLNNGFKKIGQENVVFGDGETDINYKYELIL